MMFMRCHRVLLVLLALVVAAGFSAAQTKEVASGTSPNPGTPAATQFVGSETCKACHEDQYKQIEATQHWNTNLKGAAPQKLADQPWHGCESCHGSGAAHVEGGGDKSKIFQFAGATTQQINSRCLSCHASSHPNFQRSVHAKADVSCTSCHSPHYPKSEVNLLKAKSPDLCYSCHNDAKADFNRPFHHRVNEGLMQCNDCHNVHDSYPAATKLTASQDQICLKCHAEKRGPFVFEHLPVKTEGCTSCHVPHGSNNQRLLTRGNVNNLCMECHGTSAFPTLHNQANKYQACTLCHVAIHGSNASNIFFK
jgi:DmsE family decaheme c-type cytochrome